MSDSDKTNGGTATLDPETIEVTVALPSQELRELSTKTKETVAPVVEGVQDAAGKVINDLAAAHDSGPDTAVQPEPKVAVKAKSNVRRFGEGLAIFGLLLVCFAAGAATHHTMSS